MDGTVSSDEIRVGTVERESAVRVLGDHFSAGRLRVEEYEERVSSALESRTRGDLRPLFEDLPAPYPTFLAAPALLTAPPAAPPVPAPGTGTEVERYSDKSRLIAGVLQVVLPFGIGRFYTGHTGMGVAQLVTSIMFVGVIWSIIDGILLLVNGGTDPDGRQLRD